MVKLESALQIFKYPLVLHFFEILLKANHQQLQLQNREKTRQSLYISLFVGPNVTAKYITC